MYDLHVHTTASDGLLTPAEVIDMAVRLGLTGIAITDHDTLMGLKPAIEYLSANKIGLDFIPGIEINTDVERGEVHILGYYVDPGNEALSNRLAEIKVFRRERAWGMIRLLGEMGMPISAEEVENRAQGDLIGRPHIAMALMDKGYVGSIKEAFDKYIAQGRPAYVPRYKFPPAEAIALIHQAGGKAVLAHPGLIEDRKIIDEIIALGIDGLEVYYPEHNESQADYFKKLADRQGLLVTGGSDFHGMESLESHAPLGTCGIDDKCFDGFKQKMLKNK